MMNISAHFVGKYELQERLGCRRMGEVWKAFDPHLRRQVAIKLLRAELQDDSVVLVTTRTGREDWMAGQAHNDQVPRQPYRS